MSNCVPIQIVVSGLNSPYTNRPNPIGVFTYPVQNVGLNITYNGSGQAPSATGCYSVSISVADNGYCADPFTGLYYITGNIAWQSYALGWGNNIAGQQPVAPTGLIGVQKIAAANGFVVALMNDNSLISWGNENSYNQTQFPQTSTPIKDIVVSNNTTFIIDYSGNVTGCGYLFNSLGSGYSGTQPPILTGIQGISACDNYAIAWPINKNTPITGWGDINKTNFNYSGVFGITGVDQVCANNFSCVILSKGSVSGIGQNTFGQLSWQSGYNNNIKKISCSDYSTVFLYNNNTITGYGKNGSPANGFQNFYIPDTGVQGKVLDINAGLTQTLLILNQYVSPPPLIPPGCTNIVYDTN